MKRVREVKQKVKNPPTILSTEERLRILANLIIDRVLEEKANG